MNIPTTLIQGFAFGFGFCVAWRLVNGIIGLLGGKKDPI